jgi:serine/threonine-protein kinase
MPPAPVAHHAAPPILKIREEKPAGYAPIRVRTGEPAPDPEPTARALSFLDRAASEPGGRFPWKIAAAAVLVLFVGAAAGRDYLLGRTEPAVAAVPSPAPAPPAPVSTTTGALAIDSQPSGAKVTLDGKDAGVTPLTIEGINPGRHQVTITSGAALVQRSVRIEAGKQATINLPVFSGWVAIFAPIRLEVSEGRRSLGSTDDNRILLPPGRHVLTLSSEEFGYTKTETVEISPGEERVLNLRPMGTVNLNASPWAEVWVDGARAGETPLANLKVPLGTREFIFKHPQYGERKLTTTITTTASALTVDFGRPPAKP